MTDVAVEGREGFPRVLEAIQRSGGGRRLQRKPRFDVASLPPDHPYLEVGIPIPNGRHCLHCGKELLRLQKRYCDANCQSAYKRRKAGKAPRAPRQQSPDGRCVKCDRDLTGQQTRFCSRRCTNSFHEAEKRRKAREAKAGALQDVGAVVHRDDQAHDGGVGRMLASTGTAEHILDVGNVATTNGNEAPAAKRFAASLEHQDPPPIPAWLSGLLDQADEIEVHLGAWRVTAKRA